MFELRFLRRVLVWNFLFLSLLCTVLSFRTVLSTLHLQIEKASSHPIVLFVDAVFPAMAVVFGVAWWRGWKQRPFARAWGIAASTLLAAIPLRSVIRFPQSAGGFTFLVLTIGIAGIVVFSMHDKTTPAADDPGLKAPPIEGT
jgi:hypothetical protein